ncbi:MAG: Rieske (2Fe-2S) protein [Gammaproteobacteria bacterium]|nr:Rieske (2Fe-2S) protein [Gammaproteobacteria bacterium]
MNWRDECYAPEVGTCLANLDDLHEGRVREAIYGEGKNAFRILLLKEGGQAKAYWNRCPHFGVPLNTEPGKFIMLPKGQVMCAIHCSVFNLADGQCVDGPVKGDHLTKIALEVDEKGEICIGNDS